MKNKIFIFFLFIISINLISATAYDFAKNMAAEEQLHLDEQQCNSVKNIFYKNLVKNLIFEINTKNTEEIFYMEIKEEDCNWRLEVSEEMDSNPDVQIKGDFDENERESFYLTNIDKKSKSFRGFIFNRFIFNNFNL